MRATAKITAVFAAKVVLTPTGTKCFPTACAVTRSMLAPPVPCVPGGAVAVAADTVALAGAVAVGRAAVAVASGAVAVGAAGTVALGGAVGEAAPTTGTG